MGDDFDKEHLELHGEAVDGHILFGLVQIFQTGCNYILCLVQTVKTEFFSHAFQTNQSEVQYFDRLYEAKDVVTTGLRDLYKSRKDYSIHGFPVRMQVRLVKLLPHSMVMKTWLNQQKKAKNNEDLA